MLAERLLGLIRTLGPPPSYTKNDTSEIKEVNGQLVAVNPRTKVAVPIFGEKDVAAPEYLILRDTRNNLTTPIDISTATGRAAVDRAKVTNEKAGTTVFIVSKMPSDTTPQAKAFQVGTNTVLSYDGGRTYVSADGQITSMPSEGVVPLNDTIAYEVMRAERVRALAGNQLAQLDEAAWYYNAWRRSGKPNPSQLC
jgi:hypothetical protein